MDAKEPLCTVLESLQELNKTISRPLLIDFVTGNISADIKQQQLDDHELFGSGDKHDDEYYNTLLDHATTDKYVKQLEAGLAITSKGKKFLKDPVPYIIEENDEQDGPEGSMIENVDELAESEHIVIPPHPESIGAHAKLKIQLIQAMDRKIALDDFAEQNNMEFDEVLDILEGLKHSGRDFDITYFVDEVLGKESLDELFDFFDSTDGDTVKATKELGDVYEPEEIRLARLAWEKGG